MYERSRTVVRCAVGQTEEFKVEVGLHQGLALSPFLFAMVMDQLSEEVRQESPCTIMFADDIVICSESREQVEENLERWRFALERRGMKVSRIQSNGECGKEVKKRVQAGWNGWRKVSGVLCDRKISARIKGKVYRTVVRPAMLYGLETVSLRKRQESELEVAELKMLRLSLGVTRLDRIRNEYIRGTAHVGRLGDKEARLLWTCSEEGEPFMQYEDLIWTTNTSFLAKRAQQQLHFLWCPKKANILPTPPYKQYSSVISLPEEWRRSVLVPIFKNKGDVQSCSNYRGIKLMSHTMKVWERVVEARLRKVVEICEQQYGFMPRKSTTDAIFALRILMEKYRDGQRELHCVFVDLEKAYDRVPREELWYCMRKSGVAEKYVRVVQDMYERSRTVVRCAVGQTEEFNVEVGLHQGSALSPFLFAIVMDQLSEEVRQESPWTMMFADDIVICSESREQVEENLQRWRFALERRGMKVSRSKTEYMCVNEREGSGTVRLQGEEVKKVQEFKYLGSTVQSNGECGKEVKKRVQAGWNGWRKVSGVLCDKKISARIKGKVYRTVVRAAMLYGLETVSLRKRQESELEVAELKMLRFSLGVTRLDRIRNEYIRGTAHVGCLGDKVREARLRWFGHVQRRDSEYIGRRMLDMELPGRRQRGRPKRRYMNGINEDMKLVGASVEDAEDRDRWREMIRCGDP
ncbi:hypothetical protein QTP86_032648 [Hemibagrus guttatus]|nr:hypothetical protein QTP86_032648 [Hemibagrus guttatus]